MSVYTPLEYFDVAEFVAGCGVERVHSMTPIEGGVENTVYRLETDRGSLVLTLHEREPLDRVKRVTALLAELGRRGVPVPGVYCAPGLFGSKPLSLVRFVEGAIGANPGVEDLFAMGEALGRLHRLGADLGGDLGEGPHLGRILCPWAEELAADLRMKSPTVAELVASEARLQRGVAEDSLPGGLIHADYFPDNVILDTQQHTVRAILDFQMAGRGPWLYDLAALLANGAWEGDHLNGDKARAALGGYRKFRAPEPEEIRLLPMYLRRVALRFLCLRLEKWNAAAQPEVGVRKNPSEQAEKLKAFRAMAA